jgi:transcriptional regulator with XRE-family HTH domain
MKFGERLRELRESAGLTQQQLADAAGVPIGSIRNYEQGQREPYWDVVYRLAPVLGVGCDAFQQCVQPLPVAEVKPEPTKAASTAGRPRKTPASVAEEPANKPRKGKK